MASKSPSIKCSHVEATFLASLLGANTLLGIQDPFYGWIADEIESRWAKAKKALERKRFIQVQKDDRIIMDTAVAAMIGTWAHADASFILTETSATGLSQMRYFHVTRNLGVEQISNTKSSCELTALKDAHMIFDRINRILGLKDQPAALGSSAVLRETRLEQVRNSETRTSVKEIEEILKLDRVKAETAHSLALSLAKPKTNGALVALARRETNWEVGGLGILEGNNGLWRLRTFTRDNENWVEAVPCDATQAREEVRQVMNRVLPVSL